MMMNKGISAIIAVVLLLLIAIALVGVAYIYISGLLAGKTEKTITFAEVYCNTSRVITIVLMNDGTKSIDSASDITVLVDGASRTGYVFGTIGAHTTAVASGDTIESAGEHTVIVTSPSNAIRQVVYC